jgi:hypothetical protein
VQNDLEAVRAMYGRALGALRSAKIPFAVGGAYALGVHSGIHRETKDLDIFTVPRYARDILSLFASLGFPSQLIARHWLGKATWEDAVIDVIFGFRNGISQVDESWLDHAKEAPLFGSPVPIVAIEEMIWSKAFVMERHRYDGADILHLMRAGAPAMDWRRLLDRFGTYWPLLLHFLVLFGFVYPAERNRIPEWLVRELTTRWQQTESPSGPEICRGTLLSHLQYLHDVGHEGLLDARLQPIGRLTPENVNE